MVGGGHSGASLRSLRWLAVVGGVGDGRLCSAVLGDSSAVLGGARWCSAVVGGVVGGARWCSAVLSGVSAVVGGGRRWPAVLGGARRWLAVVGGACSALSGGWRWSVWCSAAAETAAVGPTVVAGSVKLYGLPRRHFEFRLLYI